MTLPKPESPALVRSALRASSLTAQAIAEPADPGPARIESHRYGRHRQQKLSTAAFKIGPKKLDLLSRLIRRRPIGDALVQLQFSDKRAARRVKSMVALAQQHAVRYQGLDARKLVVDETWVTKGKRLRRLDIKAKAGRGLKHHTASRLHVILREGPSVEEAKRRKLEREFRIRMRTGATPFLNVRVAQHRQR